MLVMRLVSCCFVILDTRPRFIIADQFFEWRGVQNLVSVF
jgi:hypothetical protein